MRSEEAEASLRWKSVAESGCLRKCDTLREAILPLPSRTSIKIKPSLSLP
jgi:hypothetical protein